jgi:hypothetical protein
MTPPEGVHEGLFNPAYQPPAAGSVNIDPISAAAWQITILAINLKMFFLFIILFFGALSDCFGSVFNNLILIFFAFFINFSALSAMFRMKYEKSKASPPSGSFPAPNVIFIHSINITSPLFDKKTISRNTLGMTKTIKGATLLLLIE